MTMQTSLPFQVEKIKEKNKENKYSIQKLFTLYSIIKLSDMEIVK